MSKTPKHWDSTKRWASNAQVAPRLTGKGDLIQSFTWNTPASEGQLLAGYSLSAIGLPGNPRRTKKEGAS
ncbi:hypothetical protein PUN4_230132 [Paraburkholderia unamae]|nr:hypothetical protein PUN4_230132 [Paraburkholderia unamae]